MSRKRTPCPASQRTTSRESPTSARAIAGSPRPRVTRRMSPRNSSSVYGSRSVAGSGSSASSSRTSSRPPWAMRIAPAVNAELPPDQARSAFSSTSTRAPRSRAACAAHRPALPAPATMTSGSLTARGPTCDPAQALHRWDTTAGVPGGVVARSSRPDASSTTSYRRTLPTHDRADTPFRSPSGGVPQPARGCAPAPASHSRRADPRRRRLRLPRAPRRHDRRDRRRPSRRVAAARRGDATARRDQAGRMPAPVQLPGVATVGGRTLAVGGLDAADTSVAAVVGVTAHRAAVTGKPPARGARHRQRGSRGIRLRLRRRHRLGADPDDHTRCAIGTDDGRRPLPVTAVGRVGDDAGRHHLRRRRRGRRRRR